MFSQEDFIEASRNFVCVRLESYESKEHQDMVRSFLGGRFENTAFCILAPDGKERLSGTGRSPDHVLGSPRRFRGNANGGSVIDELDAIAKRYRPRGESDEMTLQDFHSFRQALNVASGDQRLLVFVAAPKPDQEEARPTLQAVFADDDIIGRFHLDFAGEADTEWSDSISRSKGKTGLVIIRADPYGQEGEAMTQLPLTTSSEEIKAALLTANKRFADSEERKDYAQHVSAGRRSGVYFENGMPYGEDRDGDGVIDHAPGKGKGSAKGKGKGKGQSLKGKGKGLRPEAPSRPPLE